jgi:hypothetical protein
MQRVQTLMLLTVPFLTALIFCRFGRQILLVLLLAWLTLFPKLGPLPQISHILDISFYPPVVTEVVINSRVALSMQAKSGGRCAFLGC